MGKSVSRDKIENIYIDNTRVDIIENIYMDRQHMKGTHIGVTYSKTTKIQRTHVYVYEKERDKESPFIKMLESFLWHAAEHRQD